jgi:CRP/FNR family transcriptional regulator, cyclic AMP receptor protein
MLENIPLFTGLTPGEIGAIGAHAVTRNYPKCAVIINEGEMSDSLYCIQSGKVKVYVSDEDGKEVILNIMGPNQYFGELALIDDSPRSASVMTMEPTALSIVSKAAFRDCLAKNPDIALNLLRYFTQRVRGLTENVKNLALLDVYGRVARTLLSLATPRDDGLVIEDKLTQQDIANMVGASREMVSRILKDLSVGGYIKTEGRQIVINEKLPAAW